MQRGTKMEREVFYRYETTLYRVALNQFLETYASWVKKAREEGGDFSLELFKTGTYRLLKGRRDDGKRPHGGWVMVLYVVDVEKANEVLHTELTLSRDEGARR